MRTWLILLLIALLAGCAPAQPTSVLPVDSQGGRRKSSYAEIECPRGGGNDNFFRRERRCGELTVPADRADPQNDDVLKLSVVVFPAESETPRADPVLFLWLGPGSQTPFAMAFPYFFEELGEDRDLIVVDQRGASAAETIPSCPALTETFYANLGLPPLDPETLAASSAASQACVDKYDSDGIDPGIYSTEEIVEDLEDLRLGLGVRQWNVGAAAYGTHVALALAGKYPTTVRAMVLDMVPASSPSEYPLAVDRAEAMLERMFTMCAENNFCQEAFPNTREKFYQAVQQLDSSPMMVETRNLDSGRRDTIYVDGGRLIDLTLAMLQLNNLPTFGELPRMIYQVTEGEDEALARMYGQILNFFEPATLLVNQRYTCLEDLPPSARDELLGLETGMTPVGAHMRRQLAAQFAACAGWIDAWNMQVAEAPAFQPPGGNMPVLVLQGGFYPTPREWAESATANMTGTQFVDLLDASPLAYLNGPGSNCGVEIAQAFLIDPEAELDTACAQEPLKTTWITFR